MLTVLDEYMIKANALVQLVQVTCCEEGIRHDNVSHCTVIGTVVALALYSNNCTGTLPDRSLASLAPYLVYLDVRNNHISGTLPAAVAQAEHIKWLLLDGNYFTGTLPESYASLSNLTMLALAQNRLTGSLPVSYTKLAKLRSLTLDKNCVEGDFPGNFFILGEIEVSGGVLLVIRYSGVDNRGLHTVG